MKDTRLSDLFVGVGFAALGAAILVSAQSLPSANFGLGSGGYPTVVSVIMILLGAVQTVTTLLKGFPKVNLDIDRTSFLRIAAAIAGTFLYVALLRHVGFLLLTPLFLFGGMMLFGYRRYLVSGVVSIALSTGIFFLFTKVFYIFLPTFRLF